MDNELYHYGVAGMRWGHSKGGSGGVYASKSNKKDIKMFKTLSPRRAAGEKAASINVLSKSSLKKNQKSQGTMGKAEKQKLKGNIDKAKALELKAKGLKAASNFDSKKMSQIKKGTLKAGEDFRYTAETNIPLAMVVGPLLAPLASTKQIKFRP